MGDLHHWQVTPLLLLELITPGVLGALILAFPWPTLKKPTGLRSLISLKRILAANSVAPLLCTLLTLLCGLISE